MFQTATFDTATINRELGWAEELGFNAMRVFLHHLLWTAGVNTSGSLIKSTIYRRFYLETSVGYPK
jgi:hypothetical protein